MQCRSNPNRAVIAVVTVDVLYSWTATITSDTDSSTRTSCTSTKTPMATEMLSA
jgi:hypothetical protein